VTEVDTIVEAGKDVVVLCEAEMKLDAVSEEELVVSEP